jgi:ribonuclease T1
MKRKILSLISFLCLFTLLLCGCGSTAESSSGDASGSAGSSASSDAGAAALDSDESQSPDLLLSSDAEIIAEIEAENVPDGNNLSVKEDGVYTSKDDVSFYLQTYGHLPDNFITKSEAKKLGWEGGSLEEYAPGKCIGGDVFGNYEGLLPEEDEYHECDIDTLGADSRGSKRLVYSDTAIYYTDDHYESFTLLFSEVN